MPTSESWPCPQDRYLQKDDDSECEIGQRCRTRMGTFFQTTHTLTVQPSSSALGIDAREMESEVHVQTCTRAHEPMRG